MSEHDEQARGGEFDVAVVGMAGRFPGAETLDEFWSNLREGVECITHFTDDELVAAGTARALLDHPGYVRSIGKLRDVRHFDAGFFGYSPREAETLEPAHRLFLECAWEALEDAAVDPARFDGTVGVYGGAGNPSYADRNVRANPAALAAIGDFAVTLASGKDFVATRASYKLDLRGPSLTVQTGCSTALVAVHLAAQSLLRGECDLALAGGSSVFVPQDQGYLYTHGGIQSPDGHCRAFDARAAGTVPGTGTGVVVLRRLEDALRDGDPVRAVIRGSAINNDGGAKVAYTAPGVDGQSAVIGEAMALAGVDADSITLVEGHGSGTELGDVIELAALTRAYRASTDRVGYCALGSVKTNLGHLDSAAGAAGLIKTVLALEHGVIPPSLNFDTPNPKTELETSPFFVPTRAVEWETMGQPRRAGVSSFGIGGTNAHVVLEEAPASAPSSPSRPWQALTLSARSAAALDAAAERLAAHLEANPHLPLADVAHTLQRGRRAFAHRRAVIVREGEDAAALLRGGTPERVAGGAAGAASPSVVFLFSGLGDHYPNMARGLYEAEPVFRRELDRCAELLRPHLGVDLREVLFPGEAPSDAPAPEGVDLRRMLAKEAPSPEAERLARTELAQPAVFAVDWALAQLWMSWGIVPEAVAGHSLGEYAAACVAGVLSLEDAAALVAARARLIQALPGGAMLAVPLDPAAVAPYLSMELAVATANAPGLSVVAGPDHAVAALEERLRVAGHVARRLATTHAFHSPMMAAAAEPLAALAARARLRPPSIPMISNVTGTWITDAEATDPAYWTRHLLGTVRFAEGIGELLMEAGRVFLEVGPGQTLATFVRQRPGGDANPPAAVVASVRYAYDRKPDAAFLAEALGRLWLAGVAIDWAAYREGERRNRLHLPTYPWEKQLYWVEAVPRDISSVAETPYGKLADPADWTWLPTWERQSAPAAPADDAGRVLVLSDGGALAEAVAAALAEAGAGVVVARAGEGFAERGGAFTLRPAKEDFAALAAALENDPPARVVHTWSDPVSLLLLAEAFGHGARAEIVVLTRGAVEVTGDEDAADPAAAAVVGASRVVPLEYPSLACRVVDVDGPAAALAARVAADVLAGDVRPLAAWRGRHRWTRRFVAARPAKPAVTLRGDGVYLFVGGLEGRSASLAEAVARGHGAAVALVARRVEPRLAEALRAAGARVAAVEADPADAAALADAVSRVEAELGAVTGVFFAPPLDEVGALAAIAEADAGAWSGQLGRVRAGLDALERALEGRRPEFVLLESSLAGVLGLPGRARVCMANAVVDAFAAARSRAGAAWTAVDWDRGHGAAVAHVGGDELGIEAGEVPAALARVLALAGEPQVLVSTAPLEERARRAGAPRPTAVPTHAVAGTYARPDLGSRYEAPESEAEEVLVEMWQTLLGIAPIGVHDDFFGMGGHSLFATQIISRVRETFAIDIPLQAIFEAPTIRRFAELVEEAVIADISQLSDEEALLLAGE